MLWPVPKSLDEASFDRLDNKQQVNNHKKEEREDDASAPKGQWGELVNLVLRAYCLALIKTCDRVNSKVSSEYFHEVSFEASPHCRRGGGLRGCTYNMVNVNWKWKMGNRRKISSHSSITAVY